jgi:hypothetical protein
MVHDDKDPRTGHAGVDNHQWDHELLEENGIGHDHHHNSHDGVGFYHDNHHDEDCIHETGHDDHNHPRRRAGEAWAIGIGLGHGGHQVESVEVSGQHLGRREVPTSATQVTRAPLNSRPSSFSTAVLRSAAVSNSTKLLTC